MNFFHSTLSLFSFAGQGLPLSFVRDLGFRGLGGFGAQGLVLGFKKRS